MPLYSEGDMTMQTEITVFESTRGGDLDREREVDKTQDDIALLGELISTVSNAHHFRSRQKEAIEFARSLNLGVRILERLEKAQEPASKKDIGTELTMLIAAWPTAAKVDVAPFAAVLAVEVSVTFPSRFALASGCKTLRRTKTFLPSIKETLEAIEAAARTLRITIDGALRLPAKVEEMERRLLADEQLHRDLANRKSTKEANH
jgi:hypothetical protein